MCNIEAHIESFVAANQLLQAWCLAMNKTELHGCTAEAAQRLRMQHSKGTVTAHGTLILMVKIHL